MAVRPIDGNELYRIEKLLDTDIVRQDKVALNLLEQVLYDIQHVPTLTPPNEWVRVEDRLPEKRQEVLCYFKYEPESPDVVCQNVYVGSGIWQSESGRVTHWMPLPEPPARPKE